RGVRRAGQSHVAGAPADEEHVQAVVGLAVAQAHAGFFQAAFEVSLERARERGERLALVGVGHLQAHLAEARAEPPRFRGDRRHAGCAWRNSAKKFAVVARPMAATSTPRSRATSSATWRTKAGSLVLPRCGTGARYGESVSTSMRSSGTRQATSLSACAFLNVT